MNDLDINAIIDDIMTKYVVVVKESAVKTATIKALEKELQELKLRFTEGE